MYYGVMRCVSIQIDRHDDDAMRKVENNSSGVIKPVPGAWYLA